MYDNTNLRLPGEKGFESDLVTVKWVSMLRATPVQFQGAWAQIIYGEIIGMVVRQTETDCIFSISCKLYAVQKR